MLKFLRVSASALALSAFVIAPVVTLLSTDHAYAKNDNGNGGGQGGNKGKGGDNGKGNGKGGGNAKSGGADKNAKSNKSQSAKAGKRAKSNNGKGLRKTVQDDFKSLGKSLKSSGLGGLFKGQKTQRTVTGSTSKKAAKASVTQSKRPPTKAASFKSDPLHPSNLGKLNGAINSSPNAKAAHIANGQYARGKGPVSLAAALAVADYNYGAAREQYDTDLASAEDTLDLVNALEEANAILERAEQNAQASAAAQAVLADPEAYTPEDVINAQATLDAAQDMTQEIADAANFIDDNPAPSLEDIEDANNIVAEGPPSSQGVIDAEDALLAQYKGDLPVSEDPELRLSEEEEGVLDAVRIANPSNEAIEEALAIPFDENVEDDAEEIDLGSEDALQDDRIDEEVVANNG